MGHDNLDWRLIFAWLALAAALAVLMVITCTGGVRLSSDPLRDFQLERVEYHRF
jgi:hypothetical protein